MQFSAFSKNISFSSGYTLGRNRCSFENYETTLWTNVSAYLGSFVRNDGKMTEEQLKALLLVSNVIVGAEITEAERDEASTCFDREGTEEGISNDASVALRAKK